MFIDTHCHLNFKAFKKDVEEVLTRAQEADVTKIIIPGAKLDSSKKAVEIAQTHASCFAAIGIHPHHANEWTEETKASKKNMLRELARLPQVVAVGEIGLDYYHYKNSPEITEEDKKLQKELFLDQCEIASKQNLPLIFHCRNAHADFISLITSLMHKSQQAVTGVLHCFDGEKEHLLRILEMGFYIGFDGNITYEENSGLRELIRLTPLSKLLLETDAPFLTPLPYRGSRNEPMYLTYTARTVASLHKKTVEEIGEITSENALRLFHI